MLPLSLRMRFGFRTRLDGPLQFPLAQYLGKHPLFRNLSAHACRAWPSRA